MSNQPNYEEYYITDDKEYVFGQEAIELLASTDPADHQKAKEVLAETQEVAKAWVTSENPTTVARLASVNDKFDMLTPEIPEHIGDEEAMRRSVIGWIALATPDDVVQFMRWNVAEHAAMQRDLEQKMPAMKERVRTSVRSLAAEGSLPSHAPAAFEQSFAKTTKVQVLDPITSGENFAGGYYHLEDFRMGLDASLLYNLDDDEALRVFAHEHGHGVEAVGFKSLHDLANGETNGWLREAFNEHVTQAMLFGNFPNLSPADRDHEGVYLSQRLLMHALTQLGELAIPPQALAEAYFAFPNDPLDAHEALRSKIDAAFPAADGNIMARISREYNQDGTTPARRDAIMHAWYDELTQSVGHSGPTAAAMLQKPEQAITLTSAPMSLPLGDVTGIIRI